MPEENTNLSLMDFIEKAWRRKWFLILPSFVIMPVAIALCFLLPKMYKATTTILVIPQNIPDAFIKSTVTMNPSEYLNVISQEIMSRTRLEKIIHELSLFPHLIEESNIEGIIAIMRENIEIDLHSRPGSRTLVSSFSLSYLGENAQTVAATTNRLASLFIEENLKSREQQAKKTTIFLQDELKKLDTVLNEQEEKISNFKQRNLGSLPEQSDANLRMLDQLILQRQRISDELNDLENRKLILQQQIISPDNLITSTGDEQTSFSPGSLQSKIYAVSRRLSELQNKYTSMHPDVISAKAELQKLIDQSSNASTEIKEETGYPAISETDQQLLALNLDIKTLKNEDLLIKSKIREYQSRVERAPQIDQELAYLTRDYENTNKAYDELMKKRLEAEQAEKLEINQQGEQFKVLDPAKVPETPVQPDRPKILLIGFLLSLATGAGLVYVMEFIDNSFYTVRDIESYLNLPVLASIPLIASQERKQ